MAVRKTGGLMCHFPHRKVRLRNGREMGICYPGIR